MINQHIVERHSSRTTFLFVGDSVWRYGTESFCKSHEVIINSSVGNYQRTKKAGPIYCRIRIKNETLDIFELFHIGVSPKGPYPEMAPDYSHPDLPIKTISKFTQFVNSVKIYPDIIFFNSALWDLARWNQHYSHEHVSWDSYISSWSKNASEIISLMRNIFPASKIMWLSTVPASRPHEKCDVNAWGIQIHAYEKCKDLSKLARRVCKKFNVKFYDIERIVQNLDYRDCTHLGASTSNQVINHILKDNSLQNFMVPKP